MDAYTWVRLALLGGLCFVGLDAKADQKEKICSFIVSSTSTPTVLTTLPQCHAKWQELRQNLIYLEERGIRPRVIRRNYLTQMPPGKLPSYSIREYNKEFANCREIVYSLSSSLASACARSDEQEGARMHEQESAHYRARDDGPNLAGTWLFRYATYDYNLRIESSRGETYPVSVTTLSGERVGQGHAAAANHEFLLQFNTHKIKITASFQLENGELKADKGFIQGSCKFISGDRPPYHVNEGGCVAWRLERVIN